jgi:hypothetical protein
LDKLRRAAHIGRHEATGSMALGGVSQDSVLDINRAEEVLFVAAVASLVPGIDPELDKASYALDSAYSIAFGSRPLNKPSHSTYTLQNITTAFETFGLNTQQLQVS